MIDFIQQLWDTFVLPLYRGLGFLVGLGYGILIAHGLLVLAVFIIAALLREKRQPSNIFAWALVLLLIPYLGVPLYFLFGGRKSRRMVNRKRRFFTSALSVAQPDADLQAFTNSIRCHNACALLEDGISAHAAIMNEIENAKSSIFIMTYILSNDAVGRQIVHALTRRAQEGLRVLLLIDSFGSLPNRGSALREFKAAGGQLSRFMPLLPLHSHHGANLRNHRKLAVFDGTTAITGGQNLDRRFLAPAAHPGLFTDFSLRIRGPIVQGFTFAFLSDWTYSTKTSPDDYSEDFRHRPAPAGDSCLDLIESGPEIDGDPLYERIISEIQECRSHMTLITPYFIPDEVMMRSLEIKAHLGRRVRLILPRRSNHRFVDLARYHFIRRLRRAGVEVLLFQPGMLHAKLFLVDDRIALTGSANFDMRSLFVNFEIGIVHSAANDIQLLTNWTYCLLPHCIPFEDQFKHSPSLPRRLAEDAAHLVSPLL